VHQSYSFISLWAVITFLWYRLINKGIAEKFKVMYVLLLGALSIALPIVLFITKPVYTYNQGIDKVFDYRDIYSSYELVNDEIDVYTVPVQQEKFLISDLYYYYYISDGSNNIYLMVDPFSGEVLELEDAWPN
jgi:hypothetical protein